MQGEKPLQDKPLEFVEGENIMADIINIIKKKKNDCPRPFANHCSACVQTLTAGTMCSILYPIYTDTPVSLTDETSFSLLSSPLHFIFDYFCWDISSGFCKMIIVLKMLSIYFLY